jgi:D-alanyl-D-alanine carboxypeptidase
MPHDERQARHCRARSARVIIIRTDFAFRKSAQRGSGSFHGPTRSPGMRPRRCRLMVLSVRVLRIGGGALLVGAATMLAALPAVGEALLLIEADSGKVLQAENATTPWHPASVTKLMTTYVTLRAVKDGRLRLDTVLNVSGNAAAQQPSKMGFKPGSKVTVDNALKMLLVKSANDMAVVLAEGVGGSVDKFSAEMNRTAQRLGMTQSNFVNPNGLPADAQVTSARDLAILARALIRDFPEYDFYWHIAAIKMGRKVMRNYNMLIDRYPGADGMKTGFICASGFNLVASATRGNRRLIAVVLGASSATARAEKAARLLEKGFSGDGGLSWLMPALGAVDGLAPVAASPPDLREEVCGKNRHRQASEDEPVVVVNDRDPSTAYSSMSIDLRNKHASLLGPLIPSGPPVEVYLGPGRKQRQIAGMSPKPAAQAQTAPPAAEATPAPWNLFGPAPAASAAPAELAAAPPPDVVPLPRPRPRR